MKSYDKALFHAYPMIVFVNLVSLYNSDFFFGVLRAVSCWKSRFTLFIVGHRVLFLWTSQWHGMDYEITGNSNVCSTSCSYQHQSSALWATNGFPPQRASDQMWKVSISWRHQEGCSELGNCYWIQVWKYGVKVHVQRFFRGTIPTGVNNIAVPWIADIEWVSMIQTFAKSFGLQTIVVIQSLCVQYLSGSITVTPYECPGVWNTRMADDWTVRLTVS